MFKLSATCAAIAAATKAGTLEVVERTALLGGRFVAICDEHGIIEVAASWADARARVSAVAK